ncbi:MAG: hypothetical protein V1906_01455 [Candidatus Woesearchaeota archaeon]
MKSEHSILGQRRERKYRFVRDIGRLIEEDTIRLEMEGKLPKHEEARPEEACHQPEHPLPVEPAQQQNKTLIDTFGKDVSLELVLFEGNLPCIVNFFNHEKIIMASVADIYQFAKCATQDEMKKFSKAYKKLNPDKLIANIYTSTRINYSGLNERIITHHFESKVATQISSSSGYWSDLTNGSISKWIKDEGAHSFLQALFNTHDAPKDIKQNLKRLHSKFAYNIGINLREYCQATCNTNSYVALERDEFARTYECNPFETIVHGYAFKVELK